MQGPGSLMSSMIHAGAKERAFHMLVSSGLSASSGRTHHAPSDEAET